MSEQFIMAKVVPSDLSFQFFFRRPLAFFSDDRYTYYYSDDIGIVSVMTDTDITILMTYTNMCI
jgi:hypothetical protein